MMNNNITNELRNVLIYMKDILVKEFPTDVLTEEYLLTSILDNQNCHAYMLLANCLMGRDIEQLKDVLVTHLKEKSNKIFYNTNQNIVFDEILDNILLSSEKELNNTKSLVIGSEHVLLSMLNPENNNYKMQSIFRNVGIEYKFLLGKTNDRTKKLIDAAKNAFAKKNIAHMPLKSEINAQSFVNNNNKKTNIENFTIDLTKTSKQGKLDELVGREKELKNMIQILARRKKNNVVIVGKNGVGKTQLVHGLANMIESGNVPDVMKNKKIVQLNIASLISGTYLRGAFEERVKGLFDEMKTSDKYILFIDDIHTVLKSTSKERDTDITSMIIDVLAEGEIRVIGTTSFKDYRNSIENNAIISRRLQKLVLEPSTKEETLEILKKNKHYYEEYHNVSYSDDALVKCVELSERYITDRSLPDSAIDVLDFSGAQSSLTNTKPEKLIAYQEDLDKLLCVKTDMLNHGDFESVEAILEDEKHLKEEISSLEREYQTNISNYKINVDVEQICQSISDLTNIPINKLNVDETKKLSNITNILKKNIIGQDEAIDKICKVIKRNKIGLGNKNKPISTMLLVGKSGTGKTLLAKKLADEIFGSESALVRIDMSEYSEKNSVAKLTGAAPGYIGYENGGQLTEAVKNKQYCVLLLDEIEKANQEVYNIFLQLFDEGRLTDASGQIVNFKNTIILMTSNVGTKKSQDFGQNIGFTKSESRTQDIINKEIKNTFSPEFINRLDQIIFFNDLTKDNLHEIVKLEINKLNNRIKEIGYSISYTDNVVNHITNMCEKDKQYGARPILRFVQDNIEDLITDELINNTYEQGHIFNLDVLDNKIIITSIS